MELVTNKSITKDRVIVTKTPDQEWQIPTLSLHVQDDQMGNIKGHGPEGISLHTEVQCHYQLHNKALMTKISSLTSSINRKNI